MSTIRETHCTGIKPRVTDAALCLSMVVIVACTVFLTIPPGSIGVRIGILLVDIAAGLCAMVLLCAGILIFLRHPLGYRLGLLAGFVLLAWFVWTESYSGESTWASLNYVSATPDDMQFATLGKLRLLSVALIAITTSCFWLRLLPARWLLRRSSLCNRTWPAFVAGILTLGVWFIHSAQPYRVPLIVDAPRAVLRVLHVEKRGLRLREIGVSTYRDRRFYVWRNDRRLFQYRFESQIAQGVLDDAVSAQVDSLVDSSRLRMLHTPPARVLREWNAEGWYVVLRDARLLAFTTEDKTAPLSEAVDLMRKIGALPTQMKVQGPVQDVCLGFCYGPVAALGFWYPNQPCFKLTSGATECR